jgi:hypothetical protein
MASKTANILKLLAILVVIAALVIGYRMYSHSQSQAEHPLGDCGSPTCSPGGQYNPNGECYISNGQKLCP